MIFNLIQSQHLIINRRALELSKFLPNSHIVILSFMIKDNRRKLIGLIIIRD